MSEVAEVLLTSDTSGSNWTNCIWDSRTGTALTVYKGGGVANRRSLCMLGSDFIVSANSTKPLIHIWPINKQDQVQGGLRFVTPGRVSAMCVSPDGNVLIAGVASTVYVWQICSGRMLAALDKHYQTISAVCFTDDGSHFVSSAQDGCVLVWNLSRVVSTGSKVQDPVYSFNDHALPVTDLHVGHGGMRAFLYTVSMDRTCRVYDLASGKNLINVVFEESAHCIAVNTIETFAYVGTSKGSIFEFNLKAPPRTKEYHVTKEDHINFFKSSESTVTSLSLSLDGETLASGSDDSNVYLWNIPSRQLVRTINHKGAITNVHFMLTPKNLFNIEIKLNLIASNLKRMMEKDENITIEVFTANYSGEEDSKAIQLGRNGFQETSNPINTSSGEEVQELQKEISKLKQINKELYEFSVKTLLNGKK